MERKDMEYSSSENPNIIGRNTGMWEIGNFLFNVKA